MAAWSRLVALSGLVLHPIAIYVRFHTKKSSGSCLTGPGAGLLVSRTRLTGKHCLSLTLACLRLRGEVEGSWQVLQVFKALKSSHKPELFAGQLEI